MTREHHSHHHEHNSSHRKRSEKQLDSDERKRRKLHKSSEKKRQRKIRRERSKLIRKQKFNRIKRKLNDLFSGKSLKKWNQKRKNQKQKAKLIRRHNWNQFKRKVNNLFSWFKLQNIRHIINSQIISIRQNLEISKRKRQERALFRKQIQIENKLKFRLIFKNIKELFTSIFNPKTDYFKVLLYSTLSFILAHISVYLIYQFVTIIVAHQYTLPTILYYYKTAFPTPPSSKLWTENNIINTFAAAPFFLFFFGVLCYLYFNKVKKISSMLRFYVIWMYIQSIGYFLGSIIAGTVTLKYFGWALAWLGVLSFLPKIALIPIVGVMFVIGFLTIKYFLQTAPNYQLIGSKSNIKKYLFSMVLFPFIFGTGFIFLAKIPELHYYEVIIYATMSFMVYPVIISFREYGDISIAPIRQKLQIPVTMILTTIVILVIFRILLGIGFHFY